MVTSETERALVVIPTYNESENISRLIADVLAQDVADVLVVDDNSPDGTGRLVEKARLSSSRVHLLSRPDKAGLAAAYTSGFKWGIQHGYTQFVEMDADFSHSPEDLPRLLGALATNDVAIGCRYIAGGKISGWSFLRRFISKGGNIYAKTILGLPYEDLTGGFNAWRLGVLEKILDPPVRSRGYAFQVELKHRAHKKNFSIVEIPIHFRDRENGLSKMSSNIVWEAALRVLQMSRNPA